MCIRDRDNRPDIASAEVAEVVALLDTIGPLPDTRKAEVALVYDYADHWAHQIQPQGASFRHDELTLLYYSALRAMGLDVDIISPKADMRGYKMICLPSSPLLSQTHLDALMASGAHLIFGPRTGSKTHDFQVPETLAPGPLQTLIPIQVTRVESLRPGYESGDTGFQISRWREDIESATLSAPNGPIWQTNTASYISAWISQADLNTVFRDRLTKQGVSSTELPAGLRLRRRGDLIFVMNYGAALDAADLLNIVGTASCLSGRHPCKPGDIGIYRTA